MTHIIGHNVAQTPGTSGLNDGIRRGTSDVGHACRRRVTCWALGLGGNVGALGLGGNVGISSGSLGLGGNVGLSSSPGCPNQSAAVSLGLGGNVGHSDVANSSELLPPAGGAGLGLGGSVGGSSPDQSPVLDPTLLDMDMVDCMALNAALSFLLYSGHAAQACTDRPRSGTCAGAPVAFPYGCARTDGDTMAA